MTEAMEGTKSRSKAGPAAFEMPKFELPSFEMPKLEIPTAFREMAEKSVSQAKETYEKMKSAAEEATDMLEDTYATATKGASDYGLKVIEAARENTNAAFDFATQLITVKSLSEVMELSTAHARRQFETLTAHPAPPAGTVATRARARARARGTPSRRAPRGRDPPPRPRR